MTDLLNRALPVLRGTPPPPPFPEGEPPADLGTESHRAVLAWWRSLCTGLASLQPSPFLSDPEERLEWREVVPHLVKSRWPDYPWDRLPWDAGELRALWNRLRRAAARGAPADVLAPDYPLPPSVLLGGASQYLDPAQSFGEHVTVMQRDYHCPIDVELGAPLPLWQGSRFNPKSPLWRGFIPPEFTNRIEQGPGAAATRGTSAAWAALLRSWLMHQVLTGSLAPGQYDRDRGERTGFPDGEKWFSLSYMISDVFAADLFRELCEDVFPAPRPGERAAGALAAFHPSVVIVMTEGPDCSRLGVLPEALRRWAEVLGSLRAVPKDFRLTFSPLTETRNLQSWSQIQARAQALSAKFDLVWSSVGYSRWSLTSKR